MDSVGLEKSGYVDKKAQVMPSWNRRYIVCDPGKLRLRYFKDRPSSLKNKERGELRLTDCTVSVDTSNNEGEFRFLITTQDHRKTFHLMVDDEYELKEWIRMIRLISDLGATKQKLMEEEKLADNADTFKLAVETLLERLENRSSESRKSVDKVSQLKWKAKTRLIEIRDEMEEKHRKLRMKQGEMKAQEKEYRDTLSHLNQALYVLQQQVRKSNEIQQKIVEIFGDNSNPNQTILDKVQLAIDFCKSMMSQTYQQSKRLSNSNIALNRQKSSPNANSNDQSKGNGNDPQAKAKAQGGTQASGTSDEPNNNDEKTNEPDRRKVRARSHSDLTVSKAAVFEDEMLKIIFDTFPEVIQYNGGTKAMDGKEAESDNATTNGNGSNVNNADSVENNQIAKVFELYHRYYVEMHLPREMDLRKVRTKCEQKWNSLRYVSNKKELARREEDEIDWIMMEMKRAIDKLTREGVQEQPFEKEKNKENAKSSKSKNNKSGKGKNKHDDASHGNINEPEHYQPPQNIHRDSTTMIPVLAHRQTWSEASDSIFQLNVARNQQYQAFKDLEDSLSSREVVKSWYEDKIANH